MSEPASPAAHRPPLLIWTLQRSGGTNLTRRLEVLAGLAHGEHEPFNVEREFGHITRDWLARPDRATLDTAMHAACTQRRLIKHCVELVPWEVSQALAEQSVDLGYRHLFLYREQPRDRLLSLTFAGGLQALHDFWSARIDGLGYGVALIYSVMAISGVIDLPPPSPSTMLPPPL